MHTENQLTVAQPQPQALSLFSSIETFETGQRMAKALASSSLVPKDFQGKVENTLIALEYANRLGESPFIIMQNMQVINGKPGLKSEYLIARINQSRRWNSQLKFKYEGDKGKDNRACTAFVIDKDGEILEGTTVSIEMAKKEGWYSRGGSKWPSMPDQMLAYRAAAFFQRLHAPDMALGMRTSEEVVDVEFEDLSKQGAPSGVAAINAKLKGKKTQTSEPVDVEIVPEETTATHSASDTTPPAGEDII